MQARHDHSMHWFDPFGSVNFADLVNLPAVSSAMPNNPMMPNHNVVRYLFWDQEPLHQETVDQTLSKFKKIYASMITFESLYLYLLTSNALLNLR